MATSDRLIDLLVEWEEQRRRGHAPTAEQLCPDDHALRESLRQRIRQRERQRGQWTTEVHRPLGPVEAVAPHVEGFEVLGKLGEGGMGVVYEARQKGLNRLVALKVIRAGAYATPQDLDRFRREAEATARLHHPNIVQVHQFGEYASRPYLVLELVKGGNLAERLGDTPLPVRAAAEMALALARAVQHAHEKGILHRDLKPANVLIAEDGTPKITDFGLAKWLDVEAGETATGAVFGSPSYMAPEQAQGKAQGPTTDVYALGAILYHLLTGRPPFRGVTVLETLEQVRTLDPVRPKSLQPKVPNDLETVCLKCLEKEPAGRYQSARELADDLQRFLSGEPVLAHSPTLLEAVARTISFREVPPTLRPRGFPLLVLSPLPLLAQLLVYFLFGGLPAYPLLGVVAAVASVALVLLPFALANCARLAAAPRLYRRFLVSLLGARLAGWVFVPIVVALARPGEGPEEFLLVFPLWALTDATFSVVASSHVGLFLPLALGQYVIALLLALALPFGPLAYGAVTSAGLAMLGCYLRPLGKRAATYTLIGPEGQDQLDEGRGRAGVPPGG